MMDMDIADKEHKCSAELKNKNSEYCNNFKRFSTTLNFIYPILSTSPLLCKEKDENDLLLHYESQTITKSLLSFFQSLLHGTQSYQTQTTYAHRIQASGTLAQTR